MWHFWRLCFLCLLFLFCLGFFFTTKRAKCVLIFFMNFSCYNWKLVKRSYDIEASFQCDVLPQNELVCRCILIYCESIVLELFCFFISYKILIFLIEDQNTIATTNKKKLYIISFVNEKTKQNKLTIFAYRIGSE